MAALRRGLKNFSKDTPNPRIFARYIIGSPEQKESGKRNSYAENGSGSFMNERKDRNEADGSSTVVATATSYTKGSRSALPFGFESCSAFSSPAAADQDDSVWRPYAARTKINLGRDQRSTVPPSLRGSAKELERIILISKNKNERRINKIKPPNVVDLIEKGTRTKNWLKSMTSLPCLALDVTIISLPYGPKGTLYLVDWSTISVRSISQLRDNVDNNCEQLYFQKHDRLRLMKPFSRPCSNNSSIICLTGNYNDNSCTLLKYIREYYNNNINALKEIITVLSGSTFVETNWLDFNVRVMDLVNFIDNSNCYLSETYGKNKNRLYLNAVKKRNFQYSIERYDVCDIHKIKDVALFDAVMIKDRRYSEGIDFCNKYYKKSMAKQFLDEKINDTTSRRTFPMGMSKKSVWLSPIDTINDYDCSSNDGWKLYSRYQMSITGPSSLSSGNNLFSKPYERIRKEYSGAADSNVHRSRAFSNADKGIPNRVLLSVFMKYLKENNHSKDNVIKKSDKSYIKESNNNDNIRGSASNEQLSSGNLKSDKYIFKNHKTQRTGTGDLNNFFNEFTDKLMDIIFKDEINFKRRFNIPKLPGIDRKNNVESSVTSRKPVRIFLRPADTSNDDLDERIIKHCKTGLEVVEAIDEKTVKGNEQMASEKDAKNRERPRRSNEEVSKIGEKSFEIINMKENRKIQEAERYRSTENVSVCDSPRDPYIRRMIERFSKEKLPKIATGYEAAEKDETSNPYIKQKQDAVSLKGITKISCVGSSGECDEGRRISSSIVNDISFYSTVENNGGNINFNKSDGIDTKSFKHRSDVIMNYGNVINASCVNDFKDKIDRWTDQIKHASEDTASDVFKNNNVIDIYKMNSFWIGGDRGRSESKKTIETVGFEVGNKYLRSKEKNTLLLAESKAPLDIRDNIELIKNNEIDASDQKLKTTTQNETKPVKEISHLGTFEQLGNETTETLETIHKEIKDKTDADKIIENSCQFYKEQEKKQERRPCIRKVIGQEKIAADKVNIYHSCSIKKKVNKNLCHNKFGYNKDKGISSKKKINLVSTNTSKNGKSLTPKKSSNNNQTMTEKNATLRKETPLAKAVNNHNRAEFITKKDNFQKGTMSSGNAPLRINKKQTKESKPNPKSLKQKEIMLSPEKQLLLTIPETKKDLLNIPNKNNIAIENKLTKKIKSQQTKTNDISEPERLFIEREKFPLDKAKLPMKMTSSNAFSNTVKSNILVNNSKDSYNASSMNDRFLRNYPQIEPDKKSPISYDDLAISISPPGAKGIVIRNEETSVRSAKKTYEMLKTRKVGKIGDKIDRDDFHSETAFSGKNIKKRETDGDLELKKKIVETTTKSNKVKHSSLLPELNYAKKLMKTVRSKEYDTVVEQTGGDEQFHLLSTTSSSVLVDNRTPILKTENTAGIKGFGLKLKDPVNKIKPEYANENNKEPVSQKINLNRLQTKSSLAKITNGQEPNHYLKEVNVKEARIKDFTKKLTSKRLLNERNVRLPVANANDDHWFLSAVANVVNTEVRCHVARNLGETDSKSIAIAIQNPPPRPSYDPDIANEKIKSLRNRILMIEKENEIKSRQCFQKDVSQYDFSVKINHGEIIYGPIIKPKFDFSAAEKARRKNQAENREHLIAFKSFYSNIKRRILQQYNEGNKTNNYKINKYNKILENDKNISQNENINAGNKSDATMEHVMNFNATKSMVSDSNNGVKNLSLISSDLIENKFSESPNATRKPRNMDLPSRVITEKTKEVNVVSSFINRLKHRTYKLLFMSSIIEHLKKMKNLARKQQRLQFKGSGGSENKFLMTRGNTDNKNITADERTKNNKKVNKIRSKVNLKITKSFADSRYCRNDKKKKCQFKRRKDIKLSRSVNSIQHGSNNKVVKSSGKLSNTESPESTGAAYRSRRVAATMIESWVKKHILGANVGRTKSIYQIGGDEYFNNAEYSVNNGRTKPSANKISPVSKYSLKSPEIPNVRRSSRSANRIVNFATKKDEFIRGRKFRRNQSETETAFKQDAKREKSVTIIEQEFPSMEKDRKKYESVNIEKNRRTREALLYPRILGHHRSTSKKTSYAKMTNGNDKKCPREITGTINAIGQRNFNYIGSNHFTKSDSSSSHRSLIERLASCEMPTNSTSDNRFHDESNAKEKSMRLIASVSPATFERRYVLPKRIAEYESVNIHPTSKRKNGTKFKNQYDNKSKYVFNGSTDSYGTLTTAEKVCPSTDVVAKKLSILKISERMPNEIRRKHRYDDLGGDDNDNERVKQKLLNYILRDRKLKSATEVNTKTFVPKSNKTEANSLERENSVTNYSRSSTKVNLTPHENLREKTTLPRDYIIGSPSGIKLSRQHINRRYSSELKCYDVNIRSGHNKKTFVESISQRRSSQSPLENYSPPPFTNNLL